MNKKLKIALITLAVTVVLVVAAVLIATLIKPDVYKRQRMVLLSIPHFSRSRYVETPFSFMTPHNLSKTITHSPPIDTN